MKATVLNDLKTKKMQNNNSQPVVESEVKPQTVYQNVYRHIGYTGKESESLSAYHHSLNEARLGLGKKIPARYIRTEKILLGEGNQVLSRVIQTIFLK